MAIMFHYQKGWDYNRICVENPHAKVLQEDLHDARRWLPKGYSFGELYNSTGVDIDLNCIWYSYEYSSKNFHVVPIEDISDAVIKERLIDICAKTKKLMPTFPDLKVGSGKQWARNHKWASFDLYDGFTYLLSFNRLINDNGKISCNYGAAQFMRYKGNVNKTENGKLLVNYPGFNDKSNDIKTSTVYNAPYELNRNYDPSAIAEHFAAFVRENIVSFPPDK